MKRRVSISVLFGVPATILLLALCACAGGGDHTTTGPPGTSSGETIVPPGTVAEAQAMVDAFTAARPSGNPPRHFTVARGDFVRDAGDFDVNAYFNTFTHLSVEPGYVLDYLYRFDGMGGRPFIYVRASGQTPYASFDAYAAAVPREDASATGNRAYAQEYLDHIRVDDTAEGFFQLATLRLMDDQFYQYWHSGYDDTTVVCDKAGLERTMTAAGSAFNLRRLPSSVQKQARKLDLSPAVTLGDGTSVSVRVVTFSKWGGFVGHTFTISRAFPHAFLADQNETLVKYDCGVQF
jgi:hypothetical protein